MEKFKEIFNFDNIGGKIKTLAKVLCSIGIIVSVIAGIVVMCIEYMDAYLIFPGLLIIIVGSLLSWVSSFFTYAFGELVERATSIDDKFVRCNSIPPTKVVEKNQNTSKNENTTKVVETIPSNSNTPKVTENEPVKELKKEPEVILPCPKCGENLGFMGFSEADLKEKQVCPFCGKEISLIN